MLMALFLIGIGVAMAQTQVQGTIVDEQGEPVIGASVLVKGTTTGTVSRCQSAYPSDPEIRRRTAGRGRRHRLRYV